MIFFNRKKKEQRRIEAEKRQEDINRKINNLKSIHIYLRDDNTYWIEGPFGFLEQCHPRDMMREDLGHYDYYYYHYHMTSKDNIAELFRVMPFEYWEPRK